MDTQDTQDLVVESIEELMKYVTDNSKLGIKLVWDDSEEVWNVEITVTNETN